MQIGRRLQARGRDVCELRQVHGHVSICWNLRKLERRVRARHRVPLAASGPVQSQSTLTQTHRSSELAPSTGWNKTVSSEKGQSCRVEDACGADWYSLQLIPVEASSFPLTAEWEAKQGGGESLHCPSISSPTSPLHPTADLCLTSATV